MRFYHHLINPNLGNKRDRKNTKHLGIVGFSRHYGSIKIKLLGVAVLIIVASVGVVSVNDQHEAYARDYDAEIKKLEKQIKDYDKHTSELAAKSDTLKNKIALLKSDQESIQAQIDLSNAEKSLLEKQIKEAQQQIDKNTDELSKNLKEQYYGSQTSVLDILMNSDSVSDYVDAQARRKAISNRIEKSVKTIKQTKSDLEKKKKKIEDVVKQQKQQKQNKQENEAEQQKLLNDTNGQEENYKKLSKETKEKKAQVQAEQQAAIAAWMAEHSTNNDPGGNVGDGSNSNTDSGQTDNANRSNNSNSNQSSSSNHASSSSGNSSSKPIHSYTTAVSQCGGGYPFCNATPDTYQSYGGFTAMGNARECVNYVQWRIYQLTGRNERHGNAVNWLSVANSGAKANTAAIMRIGSYGHIVWVESVGTGNHAGQLYISEYNWSPYQYSERWVSIGAFAGFYDPR